MSIFAAAALLATAQPATPPAPDAAPDTAPDTAVASEAIDPARLSLATITVDHVWPLGTFARMMSGTMDKILDSVLMSSFDMKVSDIAAAAGDRNVDPETASLSLRELMEKHDPHFEERMRITNRVMMTEMIPLMERMEPSVREGLSRAYAKRFDARQLTDLNRFFDTPTGKVYAAESMILFADPEVMTAVTGMGPEMVRAMPAIMAKVTQATAHLPAPIPPAEAAKREAGQQD